MDHADPRYVQYEEWVRAHSAELYRFAFRLAGKRETAEDLLQETFTEAWRSLEKKEPPDHPRAWLFQILRFRYAHLIRDHGHHLRTSHDADTLDAQPAPEVTSPLESLANQELLQNALNTLAPRIRETFLMVFLEGNTCRETADALNIPLGTVLSRLDRARQLLRAALGPSASPLAAVKQEGGHD
ncbi:MAG: RNA polymerase sigma factor [Phycisphaerae bacterium]